MRHRIGSAHILALIAIILALGGNALAFTLGKNSVGPKQLKKNAVTTAKVKKEAITAAKVKKGTLTGAQINLSTLGSVPKAAHADSADTATTANVADGVATAEPFHEVGSPGEVPFEHGCKNVAPVRAYTETVGYYKDQDGVVHLKGGYYNCNSVASVAFNLPAGFRPGGLESFPTGGAGVGGGVYVDVLPPGLAEGGDGAVECGASYCYLNGITFRAES
jgi:hypothetical protein